MHPTVCEAIKERVSQLSLSLAQETLKMALSYILLLVAVSSFVESSSAAQQNSNLPVIISPAVLSGACPSSDSLDCLRQTVREEIVTALQDISPTNCPCGGLGQWTNIADFNFSDPDVACPSGFTLITEPVRGCGRARVKLQLANLSPSRQVVSHTHVCVEE